MSIDHRTIEHAQKIYVDAYTVFFGQNINIATLREAVEAGTSIAQADTQSFLHNSFEEQKQFLGSDVDGPLLAESFSGSSAKQGLTIANAAYLVFTHSTVDALLFKFLRVIALLKPDMWEERLAKKEMVFGEIRGKSFSEVRQLLLEKHLRKIERESLMFKAKLILKFCGPVQKATFLADYDFSEGDLNAVNALRNQFVHGSYLGQPIPEADQEIRYLENTGFYFTWLLSKKFSELKHSVGWV